MKLNENIKLVGKNVILIPYEAKHVIKYHEWMQSSELQELTASNLLTIEEEYHMQKSWRLDEDKCTFLILDKQKFEETNNEIESLIGDTNLFLQSENEIIAEAEIMIADKLSRGRKFGLESMIIMIKYGISSINVKKFIAKIGQDNFKSIALFNKIGFTEESRSEIFKEITLMKNVNDEWKLWLDQEVCFETQEYK